MKRYIRAVVRNILDEDADTRFRLADAPDTSPRDLMILYADAESQDDYYQERIYYVLASNPNIPENLAEKLAASDNWKIRRRLASNIGVSARILDILANDSVTGVRYNVAENKNASMAALTKLAHDPEDDVRFGVLQNTTTLSFEIFSALAKDSNPDVRLEAACRKELTPELLDQLSNDADEYVRIAVVDNDNTSVGTLVKLSADPEWYIRVRVARNPKTPADVLRKLITDSYNTVAEAATEALHELRVKGEGV